MKKILFFWLLLSSLFLAACRKKDTRPANHINELIGTWICEGTGSANYVYPSLPNFDVFTTLSMSIKRDSIVLVAYWSGEWFNDRAQLPFMRSNLDSHIVVYGVVDAYADGRILIYDYVNKTVQYKYRNSDKYLTMMYSITTLPYTFDNAVKNYASKIGSLRLMQGYGIDTFEYYDTSYLLSRNMQFSFVNDSTISFAPNIDSLHENLLHYRATDPVAKTFIFESYHNFSSEVTRLTYNYSTDSMIFEQNSEHGNTSLHKHLKLQ